MILKTIKQNVMSIGKSIDGPVFIKPFEEKTELIGKLEDISRQITDQKILENINYDIYAIKSGDFGEKNVEYELKNSYIPMLVLHDLNLEHKGLQAQMDYVIITNKFVCILETKLLNGNIEVNSKGEFTRSIKNSEGKIVRKEGMYSPITQNQRHVDLLKRFLLDHKMIRNTPVLSLVVLANPKTIIFDKYAKKEIKEQIVRADQLKMNLERMIKNHKEVNLAVLIMQEMAEKLIEHSAEVEDNFLKKYEKMIPKTIENQDISSQPLFAKQEDNKHIKLQNLLKQYRYNTAKAANIKPYYIFNNAQMDELIEKMPKTRNELVKINGFGDVKADKYGEEILRILNS